MTVTRQQCTGIVHRAGAASNFSACAGGPWLLPYPQLSAKPHAATTRYSKLPCTYEGNSATAVHPQVAIKLIRSNDTMYKAAQTELAILRKLGASDPDNRKHCVKLLRHFEYRKHFCLVFEPMVRWVTLTSPGR